MNVKSLLIGGLLPTVLLKLGTVLMKLSMREGSSVPNYLVHATPPQGGFFTPCAVSVARSRTGENANRCLTNPRKYTTSGPECSRGP